MITIKGLTISDEASIKLMRCIKENEPEIWDVLKVELKQALDLATVSKCDGCIGYGKRMLSTPGIGEVIVVKCKNNHSC